MNASNTMRQTLLPFKALPPQPVTPVCKNIYLPGESIRPAPELPTEIWYEIFAHLEGCTLTLKTIRFVCRDWARAATLPLFSTAYLDGFITSWSKFRELCLSPYAMLVRTIYFNPLVLYEDCLDPGIWLYRYPNILRGASHATISQLYHAYYRVYKSSKTFIQRSDLDRSLEWLVLLRNCQNMVLCDDSDFESRCAGEKTSKRVQYDSTLWESTSVWARLPQRPGREIVSGKRTYVMWDVLALSKKFGSFTSLNMDLWAATFEENYAYGSATPKHHYLHVSNLPFQSLRINIKSCNIDHLEDECDELLGSREIFRYALDERFLRSFVNLRALFLSSTYTRPDTYLVDMFEKTRRKVQEPTDSEGSDDEDSDSDSDSDSNSGSIQPALDFSDLEDRYAHYRPEGFTPAMVSAHRARFKPQHIPASNLLEVILKDMIIDLRTLIFWLINLHHPPRKPLIIRFMGHVFFYGLGRDTFEATITALGLHLSYDSAVFVFHEKIPADTLYFEANWEDIVTESPHHELAIWPLLDLDEALDNLCVADSAPGDDINGIENSQIQVEFIHHPREWEIVKADNLAEVIETQIEKHFFYECTSITSTERNGKISRRITYEWVDQATHDTREGQGTSVETLTRLSIWSP